MPNRAADDFDVIRGRLDELRKEREEIMQKPEDVTIPSPDFVPTPNPNNDDYMYCGGAFKMENLGGQAEALQKEMGNWSAYVQKTKYRDIEVVTINGIAYPVVFPKMIGREYP